MISTETHCAYNTPWEKLSLPLVLSEGGAAHRYAHAVRHCVVRRRPILRPSDRVFVVVDAAAARWPY